LGGRIEEPGEGQKEKRRIWAKVRIGGAHELGEETGQKSEAKNRCEFARRLDCFLKTRETQFCQKKILEVKGKARGTPPNQNAKKKKATAFEEIGGEKFQRRRKRE